MIGAMSCMLILSGCIVKDSPAPRCKESIGIPSAGGCFGKTAIMDLEVVSAPECIGVEANHCNGGVLEIRDTCSEALQLGEIVILSSRSTSLDITETEGLSEVVERDSNLSQYVPNVDKRIEIPGRMGNQIVKLAFTKTKPLCERVPVESNL